jgi:hypothetical protein
MSSWVSFLIAVVAGIISTVVGGILVRRFTPKLSNSLLINATIPFVVVTMAIPGPIDDILSWVIRLGIAGILGLVSSKPEIGSSLLPPLDEAECITEIVGIGPVYSERLGASQILTVGDLVRKATSEDGIGRISQESEITEKLIIKWVIQANERLR